LFFLWKSFRRILSSDIAVTGWGFASSGIGSHPEKGFSLSPLPNWFWREVISRKQERKSDCSYLYTGSSREAWRFKLALI
jgi:hypothetical protein